MYLWFYFYFCVRRLLCKYYRTIKEEWTRLSGTSINTSLLKQKQGWVIPIASFYCPSGKRKMVVVCFYQSQNLLQFKLWSYFFACTLSTIHSVRLQQFIPSGSGSSFCPAFNSVQLWQFVLSGSDISVCPAPTVHSVRLQQFIQYARVEYARVEYARVEYARVEYARVKPTFVIPAISSLARIPSIGVISHAYSAHSSIYPLSPYYSKLEKRTRRICTLCLVCLVKFLL